MLLQINQAYHFRLFYKTDKHCNYLQSTFNINYLQKLLKLPSRKALVEGSNVQLKVNTRSSILKTSCSNLTILLWIGVQNTREK